MASRKTISASRIARYAKICAAHIRLYNLRYVVRGELLKDLEAGAVPSESGPFLLKKSFQSRIDQEKWSWKMFAIELAMRLGKAQGMDEAASVRFAMREVLFAEINAERKDVTVLQAKPNPAYQGELFPFKNDKVVKSHA